MTVVNIGDNTTGSPTMDFTGTEDTWLRENATTTNYGSETTVFVADASGADFHGCFKFPGLSNISASAIVSAAVLNIYQVTGGASSTYCDIYRLLRDWVEGEATWNIYSTGNNWGTAGGINATDRSGTTTGTIDTPGVTGYQTNSSAQLVTDVQNFVDGTWGNYGWHLDRNSGASGNSQYGASDGTDGQRPYLSVTYTVASGGIEILRRRMEGC